MNKYKGEIITLLLSLIFVFGFYSETLQNLNNQLFSDQGDGIKNYYTYYYHINYDKTFNDFEGMNYPYGEMMTYVDGQPAIANTLKFLQNISPFFADNAIGILNFLLIFSFILTTFFLYKILKHYELTDIPAAFFAIGIMALAPQINRITGHFGMAYSFAIPLVYYLIIKKGKAKNHMPALYLGVFNTILFFIHPYMAIISIAFIVIFDALKFAIERNEYKKKITSILIAAILPLLLFQTYSILADSHVNRPKTPGGFYDNLAKVNSVFVPHDEYLLNTFKDIFNIGEQPWESLCYIGIFSILTLFFVSNFRFFWMVYTKQLYFKKFFKKEENILLLAGFLVLLYAFGYPWIIGFDFILDLVPPIKQVRVLARFAWVFFFAVNIFASVKVYHWFNATKLKDSPYILTSILIVIALVNLSEAWMYHVRCATDISIQKNLFKDPSADKDLKALIDAIPDAKKYQAIISLPFYYEGMDEYLIASQEADKKYSMLLSFQLQLPLLNAYISRTSLTESNNVIESFSFPYLDKKIRKDLPSNKPIFIMRKKGQLPLKEEEMLLLARAYKIADTEKHELYEISVENWLVNESEQEIKKFMAEKDKLFRVGSFYVKDPADLLYFNDFENEKGTAEMAFNGKKCYKGLKKDYNLYFKGQENGKFPENQEYNISYWYYRGTENALINMGVVEEVDKSTGKSDWYSFETRNSMNLYKGWQMVSADHRLQNNNSDVNVFNHQDANESEFFVDAFLIKKKDANVYRVKNGMLYKNNFPVGKININDDNPQRLIIYSNKFEQNIVIHKDFIYCPGLEVLGKDASWRFAGKKMLVKAKIKAMENETEVALVLSQDGEGKSKSYAAESFLNISTTDWITIQKEFTIPFDISPEDVIKSYIYSVNGKKVIVDEFEVSIVTLE